MMWVKLLLVAVTVSPTAAVGTSEDCDAEAAAVKVAMLQTRGRQQSQKDLTDRKAEIVAELESVAADIAVLEGEHADSSNTSMGIYKDVLMCWANQGECEQAQSNYPPTCKATWQVRYTVANWYANGKKLHQDEDMCRGGHTFHNYGNEAFGPGAFSAGASNDAHNFACVWPHSADRNAAMFTDRCNSVNSCKNSPECYSDAHDPHNLVHCRVGDHRTYHCKIGDYRPGQGDSRRRQSRRRYDDTRRRTYSKCKGPGDVCAEDGFAVGNCCNTLQCKSVGGGTMRCMAGAAPR